MTVRARVLFALIASSIALQAAPVQPITREWTDSDGRKARMTLLDVEGGTVEFATSSGRSMKLPVERLSAADQRFVRVLREARNASSRRHEWPETVQVTTRDIEIELVEENDDELLGHVYRTAHFEFRSEANLGIAVMKDVGRLFEATRELLLQAPWSIGPKPNGNYFRAELYETRESYVAAGGPENSGGVFFRDGEKFMVPFQSLGLKAVGKRHGMSQNYSVQTLVHELTHQMMREWLPVLPQWFVEGSAEYTSLFPYNAGKFRCSGIKAALKDYVRNRKSQGFTPKVDKVGDLLRMTNAEWHRTAARGPGAQTELYYDSLLLTYYFMHLDGEGDGRRFYTWLDSVPATREQVSEFLRGMREFGRQEGVSLHADGTFTYPPNLAPQTPPEILASREAFEVAGSKHIGILLDGRSEQELKKEIRNAYSAIGVR